VFRPFVVDRNIRHFLWCGGVAGEGLRSVGVKPRPHPRASALSCPSSAICGPGKSPVGQPRPVAARPSLCALEAWRWVVGGESMTTPGGTRTPCQSVPATPPCSAHRLLSWAGAFGLLGSGPSLCPGPMLQGVSYVQVSGDGVYIRNIIPIRAPAGLSRVQSKPLPGRARMSHLPPDRTFFYPTSGKKNSAKFAPRSSHLAFKDSPYGGCA
jgi:hypothetical protein